LPKSRKIDAYLPAVLQKGAAKKSHYEGANVKGDVKEQVKRR